MCALEAQLRGLQLLHQLHTLLLAQLVPKHDGGPAGLGLEHAQHAWWQQVGAGGVLQLVQVQLQRGDGMVSCYWSSVQHAASQGAGSLATGRCTAVHVVL